LHWTGGLNVGRASLVARPKKSNRE